MRRVTKFLATGAYVGLVPIAPGTAGSLLALPLGVGLARLELPAAWVVALLAAVALLSIPICDRAGRELGDPDSGRIVLDEICGMLIAGALIPPTTWSVLLTFTLFRVLDVCKPFPAGYLDRAYDNGVGVVADDIVAGIYANLLTRVLM